MTDLIVIDESATLWPEQWEQLRDLLDRHREAVIHAFQLPAHLVSPPPPGSAASAQDRTPSPPRPSKEDP